MDAFTYQEPVACPGPHTWPFASATIGQALLMDPRCRLSSCNGPTVLYCTRVLYGLIGAYSIGIFSYILLHVQSEQRAANERTLATYDYARIQLDSFLETRLTSESWSRSLSFSHHVFLTNAKRSLKRRKDLQLKFVMMLRTTTDQFRFGTQHCLSGKEGRLYHHTRGLPPKRNGRSAPTCHLFRAPGSVPYQNNPFQSVRPCVRKCMGMEEKEGWGCPQPTVCMHHAPDCNTIQYENGQRKTGDARRCHSIRAFPFQSMGVRCNQGPVRHSYGEGRWVCPSPTTRGRRNILRVVAYQCDKWKRTRIPPQLPLHPRSYSRETICLARRATPFLSSPLLISALPAIRDISPWMGTAPV